MSEELGRIERPSAEQFALSRKIYLVPLVVCGEDAPTEFVDKCKKYWEQARVQVEGLEVKVGKVAHVYHESIVHMGEDGMKIMERYNPEGYRLTREKCGCGAVFDLIEDRVLAEEAVDWERCMMIGFVTESIAAKVNGYYQEASRKRYDHMTNRISSTLKAGEAGLLLISQGHRLQFPRDIEVFIVSPPALDEVQRWLREDSAKSESHEHNSSCNHD
jgi:hypothetical protein